jgi:F420-0:gamma-glutamyl ligase-like protein
MPKHVGAKYLLTPWSRVLLGTLNGPQLVKKFPTFHGTQRFVKAFASAHRSDIRIYFYVSSVNTLVV